MSTFYNVIIRVYFIINKYLNWLEMSDLLEENQLLKQKIEDLEERLKKYTAPERNLNYYHKNKEKIAD
jgi:cell division septum initiation protein DivIVA